MFLADKLNKGGSLGGYQISRSLRFNSADSAYLNRTFPVEGNRQTWTWSAWVKRSILGGNQALFARSNTGGTEHTGILFSSDCLRIFSDNGTYHTDITSTQVFRDLSAWYHIVVALDTTQATSTNRLKMYVNGSQITSFSTTQYPAQNSTPQINTANPHGIGRYLEFSGNWYLDGYMTEVNFVNAQQLTPSSFGETNAQTGVWQPKAYSGSYGTNGFYLNFSDNSNTTAATLGKDYSGNGNNWTPNNFSVTAGAGNDSLVDSPTSYGTTDTGVGGEIRGNYATWNPLTQSSGTASNGNLQYYGPNSWKAIASTFLLPSTGKWFAEVVLLNAPLSGNFSDMWNGFGVIAPSAQSAWSYNSGTSFFISDTGHYSNYSTGSTGNFTGNTTGTVLGLAFDRDTNQITVYQNGVSKATVTVGVTSGSDLYFFNGSYSATYGSMAVNFGQRPFAYTAPSGYKALCTQNLPTPTIGATTATQAGKYFDVTLYTGTASTQTIANSAGFAPDLVWAKNRSNTANNMLANKLSGNNLYLKSNTTDAESAINVQLVSNGFTTSGVGADINASGNTYVAWQWKANGSGSTNTSGSITSTVSANTTSGFSVLTYTGTGTAATIGHGLGVAPSMLIFKSRSNGSENWNVYHKSLGASTNILLNSTIAAFTDAAFLNATAPTSTVLSVGGAGSTGTNQGSATFVCYAFAEVAGYSKFGSYTGNGSSDGVFIYLGFRPKYVMIKCSSSGTGTGTWWINDSVRSPSNVVDNRLAASDSNAEQTGIGQYDFVSNGIKIRDSNIAWNGSGYTYIFMAFAESPFKYALAR